MRFSAVFLLTVLAFGPGCYFTRSPSRPLPALEARLDANARQRCLVVMVPGFLDGPDAYVEHGFPRDLSDAGSPCDAVMVDLHYRYYGSPGVADIVYEDILVPAAARGYEEIWMVGISMGGLGALLTAEAHPEMIDGIILLAPFVGERSVLREIETGGGAATWRPPSDLEGAPRTQANYTARLWSWLRGYHTDPDVMPPLYLGWGSEDRLGTGDALLAALIPEDHVFGHQGGHNWATWRPLFQQILLAAEPGL